MTANHSPSSRIRRNRICRPTASRDATRPQRSREIDSWPRLAALRALALGRRTQLHLEFRKPGRQPLVFIARLRRHFLDGLEFLACDDVEIAQNALRLGLEDGLDLFAHAARDAGGVVHQPRHLVEETVGRLHHEGAPTTTPERMGCASTW